MKKGKKLTDNDLEKFISGGSIIEMSWAIADGSRSGICYQVVNENGEKLGELFFDLVEAQEFAKNNKLNTNVISYDELWELQEKTRRKKSKKGGVGVENDVIC